MGTLVFCDIEGTLVTGSLAHAFVAAGRARGLFPVPRLAAAYGYTLLSLIAPRHARPGLRWRALLVLLAGRPAAAVAAAGQDALVTLRGQFKPAVLDRLAAHRAAGDMVILLSGGLHQAAEMIAAEVGAAAGEGTRAEMRDGVFTGRMGAPINHGRLKARRAAAIAAAHGRTLRACAAYGDSAADIPLLGAVGEAVAVDPDSRLRAVAAARGWEILNGQTVRAAGAAVPAGS